MPKWKELKEMGVMVGAAKTYYIIVPWGKWVGMWEKGYHIDSVTKKEKFILRRSVLPAWSLRRHVGPGWKFRSQMEQFVYKQIGTRKDGIPKTIKLVDQLLSLIPEDAKKEARRWPRHFSNHVVAILAINNKWADLYKINPCFAVALWLQRSCGRVQSTSTPSEALIHACKPYVAEVAKIVPGLYMVSERPRKKNDELMSMYTALRMAEKIAQSSYVDWRPTESVPEDFYAL